MNSSESALYPMTVERWATAVARWVESATQRKRVVVSRRAEFHDCFVPWRMPGVFSGGDSVRSVWRVSVVEVTVVTIVILIGDDVEPNYYCLLGEEPVVS